ncbi:FAD-binding protein [Candidatus Woesearchaeota archaeon]|nr:FAD-binding protein [Candidatus Woesearchaeota archaeon]
MHDVIIIGGGCGGMSAGIYAARYGLSAMIISKEIGGTLNEAHKVCNYPGYKDISGFDLMLKFKEQAESLGVEFTFDEADKVEKKDRSFIVHTKGRTFEGRSLILALGLQRRHLNVPGEDNFIGKGVSYCYTCDAAFYKDKVTAVVGGSDSAALAAILLAQYAEKVFIIYRKDELRCEPINKKAVDESEKIEIITNTNVTEAKGDDKLKSIMLDREFNSSDDLAVDGLFIEIGSIPSTVLAEQIGVEIDDTNLIKVDRSRKTNLEGVYAAGDCTDTPMKQAITAAADGAVAAFSTYQYIKKKKVEKY